MAIKLYKSQLTPTTEGSNVLNKNYISMAEAASIGNAWKGMVKSGEELYVTHQDIKTDNEILEKSKEVMNGGDNFQGLTKTKIDASEINDPDVAGKLYNDQWQTIFDNVNNTLSNGMAKKKFKSFMTTQNLKDMNAIKIASTTNMINSLRLNTLDKIETLKKSIIYGSSLESQTASIELKKLLKEKKTSDIFGNTLETVTQDTNKEIAFYGYKNVAIADQDKALAAAKKDKRLDVTDVQKLITHFKTSKTTSDNINKNIISNMESNLSNGIIYDNEEFNTAVTTATQNGDQKSLIKLNQMAIDAPIIQDLNTKTIAEIENKINVFTNFKNKEGSLTTKEANELIISQEYLAKLNTSLDKDLLSTANNKGVVAISEIGFEELLTTGDLTEFVEPVKERIARAETAAAYYKRKVKYLTSTEAKAIKDAFDGAETTDQIISLSAGLVKAFGGKSDKVFEQISKDDSFLAHLGGLVMMNNGVPGNNVTLAAEGFILSKNKDLAGLYKITSADVLTTSIISKYGSVFNQNPDTLNNVIETANLIYAATLKRKGETKDKFNVKDYEDAFIMAVGGSTVDGMVFNTEMGGFDEDTRGNAVHIPPWLKRGKFEDVIKMFSENIDGRRLFKKASSNDEAPMLNGESYNISEIFKEQDPYFISIGNGKYKVAQGDNPNQIGGEPEYLMNTDGGYFIIDLNKIQSEIITRIN